MRASALLMLGAAWMSCRTVEAPLAKEIDVATAPIVERPPETWRTNTRLVSNGGEYALFVTPDPRTFPDNEAFSFVVHICEAHGKEPLAYDAALSVDAAMPQHGHGMNRRPIVQANADGGFTVDGMYFHMTGRWELYLDVTRGAWTERTQCTVELADE